MFSRYCMVVPDSKILYYFKSNTVELLVITIILYIKMFTDLKTHLCNKEVEYGTGTDKTILKNK